MIGIAGAGAFGTALAVALANGGKDVRLWGRDPDLLSSRESPRLPGVRLPLSVELVPDAAALSCARLVLLAVPMQALRGFLQGPGHAVLGTDLVACCKGLDLETLQGPSDVILACKAKGAVAVLTGPGFAADIARGLPTALTLACARTDAGWMQHALSTPALRLYQSSDVVGSQLGGALKNVVAIAAGVVIGAGLGDSARAALVTRGYAEMLRLALALGARAETLAGLSGLGDLVLTATSLLSRNFAHGVALGAGRLPPATTVEGVATAQAVAQIAAARGIEMPVAAMVARLVVGDVAVEDAVRALMTRPLKKE